MRSLTNLIRNSRQRDDAVVYTGGESGGARLVAAEDTLTESHTVATTIIAEATEQAEQLLAAARGDIAALRVQAYEEGFRQGHAEAAAAVEERVRGHLELLSIAAADVKTMRALVLRNTERDAIELVLDIVRKILGERAAADPLYAVELAEQALARAGNQNVVRIRVHPERREIVAAAFAERHDAAGNAIEVADDQRLDLGGCVIDLRAGLVDASISTQFEETSRALRALLDEDSHDDR